MEKSTDHKRGTMIESYILYFQREKSKQIRGARRKNSFILKWPDSKHRAPPAVSGKTTDSDYGKKESHGEQKPIPQDEGED